MTLTAQEVDQVQVGGAQMNLGKMFAAVEKVLRAEPLDEDEGEGVRVMIPMALFVTVRDVGALKALLADVSDGIDFTLGDPEEGITQGDMLYIGYGDSVADIADYDVWFED